MAATDGAEGGPAPAFVLDEAGCSSPAPARSPTCSCHPAGTVAASHPMRRREEREVFTRASFGRARPVHRHAWLWEPLEADPTFVLRPMFGTRAVYLDGRLVLCFSAQPEPWRGVLVCTERVHQESLRRDWPDLVPHPVLPKWLYLPESADGFEAIAVRLVAAARRRDPRLGILPPAKRSRR